VRKKETIVESEPEILPPRLKLLLLGGGAPFMGGGLQLEGREISSKKGFFPCYGGSEQSRTGVWRDQVERDGGARQRRQGKYDKKTLELPIWEAGKTLEGSRRIDRSF